MYRKCLVPAYLCIALLASTCSAGNPRVAESKFVSDTGSTQQTGSAHNSNVTPDPAQLMEAVRRAYTGLTYYRSKGTHRVLEEFRGKRVEYAEIPFEIKYSRDRAEAVLSWTDNELEKTLKIEGKNSWLEIAGKKERTFSTPDEAIALGLKTQEHDDLFPITFFALRDQMRLGEKFFSGLVNLESKPDEVVDGHTCSVLTGTYNNVEARDTYWIDNETGVIRRIQKVIVIRTRRGSKEYISTSTSTEDYTEIELNADLRS
jgi:hypothetical protein